MVLYDDGTKIVQRQNDRPLLRATDIDVIDKTTVLTTLLGKAIITMQPMHIFALTAHVFVRGGG